jgi:hypothetical protein
MLYRNSSFSILAFLLIDQRFFFEIQTVGQFFYLNRCNFAISVKKLITLEIYLLSLKLKLIHFQLTHEERGGYYVYNN